MGVAMITGGKNRTLLKHVRLVLSDSLGGYGKYSSRLRFMDAYVNYHQLQPCFAQSYFAPDHIQIAYSHGCCQFNMIDIEFRQFTNVLWLFWTKSKNACLVFFVLFLFFFCSHSTWLTFHKTSRASKLHVLLWKSARWRSGFLYQITNKNNIW